MQKDNELSELHPDKQLALRIERGEITQAEVNHVWAETRDLSAQTPFEVRQAVVMLRKCGSLNDAWPVFFAQITQMMSEMRGAMVGDHSKFAHLVAGTETVVRELQKVGPFTAALQDLRRDNRGLHAKMDEILKRLDATLPPPPLPEAESDALEAELMDFEKDDEQARKETIGSAWAKP